MFYVSAFQNMIPLLSLISFGVSFSISKHIIPLLSLISFAFFWFCLKCFTAIFSCLNYLIRSLQVKFFWISYFTAILTYLLQIKRKFPYLIMVPNHQQLLSANKKTNTFIKSCQLPPIFFILHKFNHFSPPGSLIYLWYGF